MNSELQQVRVKEAPCLNVSPNDFSMLLTRRGVGKDSQPLTIIRPILAFGQPNFLYIFNGTAISNL